MPPKNLNPILASLDPGSAADVVQFIADAVDDKVNQIITNQEVSDMVKSIRSSFNQLSARVEQEDV